MDDDHDDVPDEVREMAEITGADVETVLREYQAVAEMARK